MKRTVITKKKIHNKESKIIISSFKPINLPNSDKIVSEPFQRACPKIAIKSPAIIDFGGIIFILLPIFETLTNLF